MLPYPLLIIFVIIRLVVIFIRTLKKYRKNGVFRRFDKEICLFRKINSLLNKVFRKDDKTVKKSLLGEPVKCKGSGGYLTN